MASSALRHHVRVFWWPVRLRLGQWLLLWPLFVTVALAIICVSALPGGSLRGPLVLLLPNLYSTIVLKEPFAQYAAQAALMGLILYAFIRLPSTIASDPDAASLQQSQRRVAGVAAFYRVLRSHFLSDLTFKGRREEVVTNLAEDICDNWFPENLRYAKERAEAFTWLCKNSQVEESANQHRTIFGALEVRGMPYVISELRGRLGGLARREVRRAIGCQLELAEDGSGRSGFSVRADECGCSSWDQVSSLRLCGDCKSIEPGKNYVIRAIDKRRLRRPPPVKAASRSGRTALVLMRPSTSVASLIAASSD